MKGGGDISERKEEEGGRKDERGKGRCRRKEGRGGTGG